MSNLELILSVLRLEGLPYTLLAERNGALRFSLLVVFLSGLSQSLGQSVVLFANEVKPHRFVSSLLVAAFIYVFGFLFLSASIWLVASYVFDKDRALIDIIQTVGLSYAPYLFSFFILAPYFGSFISTTLSLWSLAALLIALQVTLGLSLSSALMCSALGWVLLQILQRTVGRPVGRTAQFLRRLAAGKGLELNPEELRKMLRQRKK